MPPRRDGPCTHCLVESSSQWRNGPAASTLCNACGVAWSRKGVLPEKRAAVAAPLPQLWDGQPCTPPAGSGFALPLPGPSGAAAADDAAAGARVLVLIQRRESGEHSAAAVAAGEHERLEGGAAGGRPADCDFRRDFRSNSVTPRYCTPRPLVGGRTSAPARRGAAAGRRRWPVWPGVRSASNTHPARPLTRPPLSRPQQQAAASERLSRAVARCARPPRRRGCWRCARRAPAVSGTCCCALAASWRAGDAAAAVRRRHGAAAAAVVSRASRSTASNAQLLIDGES